ncbi:MAG: DUF4142 domain-containing protein [Bacteroidales bacterium]
MRGWIAAVFAALLPFGPAMAEEQGLPPDPRGGQRLAAPQRQMLATIARNSATAAQLGTLASNRAEPGRLGALAQAMALTNTGLSRALAQTAGPENLPLRERLDENELARLRALASNNHERFGQELVAWINRHYPDTITGIDMLGRSDPRYAALAEVALPQLREQLAAAQQLAQAATEGGVRESH